MRLLAFRQRAGLILVLLASLGLGAARVWAVPPGYNVDEWARLPSAIRLAGCWRQLPAWAAGEPEAHSPLACLRAGHLSGNPAYYFLLSLPIIFIPDTAPAPQYYAARLLTVGLGLITLGLAWLACRELLGRGRRPNLLALAAVCIPAAVALNQSFGDIVSGVNSDASAMTALALLTYSMARVEARRGQPGQVVNWAWLGAGMAVAFFFSTASAQWLGVPVAVWWLVSQLGPRIRLGILAALAVAGLAVVALPLGLVTWQTPRYWFNAGPTEILGSSTRVEADGPLGPHTLLIQAGAQGRETDDEVQYLPDNAAARLAGQPITFGAWLRAPAGTRVFGPVWDDGTQQVGATATATGEWQWVAATALADPGTHTAAIVLRPPPGGTPVWYDGLLLAEGTYPLDTPPSFADLSGKTGQWGGQPFTNLLLNPSVEAVWPSLRTLDMPRDVISYNGRLHSLLAWARTTPILPSVLSWLFASFWSAFSGLHPGLTRLQLLPLALFTLAGGAGALLTVGWPRPQTPPRLQHAVRFFLPISVIIWLTVILRADLWPNLATVLSFAGARYALTAVVPTTALLIIGMLYWLPPRWQPWALVILIAALWFVSLHVLLREQIPFYVCLLNGTGTGGCLGG